MEIFKVFGLDWKVLAAQFLNFAILFFVLYRFAYKPMFKFLEERRGKIEEGIENAVLAENRLKDIIAKEKEILKKAKKEASDILAEARAQAEENKRLSLDKVREEMGVLMSRERENMKIEKAEVLKSIKKEVASLVVLSLEKVLGEKLSDKKDEEVVKKIIAKI